MKSLFCFLTVALVALTSVANGAVTNVVLVHGAFTDGSGFGKRFFHASFSGPSSTISGRT
jgi:hypothetical protein